jgi:hypothetical protein
MELNVKDPAGAVNMWMRVATLLMRKMNVEHLEITREEIDKLSRENLAITVSFHMQHGIRLNLVDIEELKRVQNAKHI